MQSQGALELARGFQCRQESLPMGELGRIANREASDYHAETVPGHDPCTLRFKVGVALHGLGGVDHRLIDALPVAIGRSHSLGPGQDHLTVVARCGQGIEGRIVEVGLELLKDPSHKAGVGRIDLYTVPYITVVEDDHQGGTPGPNGLNQPIDGCVHVHTQQATTHERIPP